MSFGAVVQQVILQILPHEIEEAVDPGPVPSNALLAEDGTPILDESGNYILVEP